MPEPQVFLNGQFLPLSEARLSWHDAGFVFGATVTDLCRTFRQRPSCSTATCGALLPCEMGRDRLPLPWRRDRGGDDSWSPTTPHCCRPSGIWPW